MTGFFNRLIRAKPKKAFFRVELSYRGSRSHGGGKGYNHNPVERQKYGFIL